MDTTSTTPTGDKEASRPVPDEQAPRWQDDGKPLPAYWMAATLLGIVLLTALRKPGFFTLPQFWSEDANMLFLQAHAVGWNSLLISYPGYYIMAERVVACLTTRLSMLWAPAIYCYANLAFLVFTAWFCLRARLDYLVDARGRVALAIALVLAPQDSEVLMILIGSLWVLMPMLLILILQEPPTRPGQMPMDFVGLFLAGLTGPFIVLYAPWFLLRLRRITGGFSRYNVELVGTAWILAFAQLQSMLRIGLPHGVLSQDPQEWIRQLVFVFPGTLFFGAHVPAFLGQAFWVISPLLLGLLGWACWRGERHRSWAAIALCCCGLLAYWGGIRTASPNLRTDLNPFGTGARYFYPFYLFALWMGIIFLYDASKSLRQAARVALLMILLASASFFRAPARPNLHWETYARKMEAGEPQKVPILPDWVVDLPARK